MARDARYKWWIQRRRANICSISRTDPLEMNNLADKPEHAAALNKLRNDALTQLRTAQVNLAAAGSKSKVQRLREAEAAKEKN